MLKIVIVLLALCVVAGPAYAQTGGGQGHGGGQGRGGGHRGAPPSGGAPAQKGVAPPTPADKPTNQIEIIGVVKGIDPAAQRITIAYEAVDGLNWPAGVMPFGVSKTSMLTAATVGERVRFKLDSQQISELKPY